MIHLGLNIWIKGNVAQRDWMLLISPEEREKAKQNKTKIAGGGE